MKLRARHIEALQIVRDGYWHDVCSCWNAGDPNRGVWGGLSLFFGFMQCAGNGLLEENPDRRNIWVRITDKGRKVLEDSEGAA
jgi:hypothetical protein